MKRHHIFLRSIFAMGKVSSKGFTIFELLLSSGIAFLVFGLAWSVYIFIETQWQEGFIIMSLERDAAIAMEKMLRGISGRNGLREAKVLNLPDDSLEYVSVDFAGVDDVTRRFYFTAADNTIYYDDDTSAGGTNAIIARHVDTLTFSRTDRAITIDLVLEQLIRGRTKQVHLQTELNLRN